MDKYIEAELELAGLLGYEEVTEVWYDKGGYAGWNIDSCFLLPRWARDDAAAFQLMIEFRLDVTVFDEGTESSAFLGKRQYVQDEDHPDKASAVRFAIVQAVISKLKMSSAGSGDKYAYINTFSGKK